MRIWKLRYSGRSPHARRSRTQYGCRAWARRSISACAEEPRSQPRHHASEQVDLRMRGGARAPRSGVGGLSGRSPHARRSRVRLGRPAAIPGSISACAEEPAGLRLGAVAYWVDLRMRGGAQPWCPFVSPGAGRSPHARRSHAVGRAEEAEVGSISACAEEPSCRSCSNGCLRVDLRMRGGARRRSRSLRSSSGRSPHARRSRVRSCP